MKTIPRNVHTPNSGFTVIEVVFAVAILTATLLVTSMAMQATMSGAETTTIHAGLNSKAAAVMDRMARELKDTGVKYSNFSIGLTQQSITFARCIGCVAGQPVFGNQITYAFVTYGTKSCLERTEIVDGVSQNEILTEQLVSTPLSVTTAQGVVVNVTGINFQMFTSDTVTITIAFQQANYRLQQNRVIDDDMMIVTGQTSVQMLNN